MTSSPVDLEQAHLLREAETRWLRQSAARIRAAHARADEEPTGTRSERGEDDR